MKRLLLILLLVSQSALAAITDRYVTSTGTDTYANSTSSSTPMSLTTALANAVAGDRINIKADATYTRTASDTFATAGTVTSPIIFRGYSSTIGDAYLGRTNDNGALITTNMPLIAYNSTFNLVVSGNFVILESLQVTNNNSGTSVNLSATAGTTIRFCKVTQSSTNAAAEGVLTGSLAGGIIFNNDITMAGASGGKAAVELGAASNGRVIANRINGGPGTAKAILLASASSSTIAFNTIYSTTSNAIASTNTSQTANILCNTIVGGGADAINFVTGSTNLQFVVGNMITDNTGDGVDMVSTANAAFVAYNRLRGNATTYNNAGDWITATTIGDVTSGSGSSSDYVGFGSNDYRLISSSAAKGAAQPLWLDMGALQRQETAAQTSHVWGR